MAFRDTSVSRLPSHCQAVVDGLNLNGKIDFVSLNSKYCRIVFNEALTTQEVEGLENSSCFHKFMDPFVDTQAVFFYRFE